MSRRLIDENGFWEVKGNPLTKVGVFDYLGREIGAPDPDKIYKVYRPANEIEKAIPTYKLKPFINEHEWLGKEGTDPEKKGILGVIGEQVYMDDDYLRGNIKILAKFAQDLINEGKIELSAGYKCEYIPESGAFNGQKYDYIQKNIRCNHVALVKDGRSGPDVSVLDHGIITIDTKELLPMTLEEILKAIADLTAEEKSKLKTSLFPAGEPTGDDDPEKNKDNDPEKNKDKDPEKSRDQDPVDKDEALEAAEKADEASTVLQEAASEAASASAEGDPSLIDKAEESIEEVEEVIEEIKDKLDAATVDRLGRELKLARFALDSAKKVRDINKKALDELGVIKMLGERDALVKKLVPHIGTFDHSLMTAQQVAAYGCEKLGIKCKKGSELVALDAALQVKKSDGDKKTIDNVVGKVKDVAQKFWRE